MSVVMLSVITQSVIELSAVVMNVIMLRVVDLPQQPMFFSRNLMLCPDSLGFSMIMIFFKMFKTKYAQV
jgi:hypothetical protein